MQLALTELKDVVTEIADETTFKIVKFLLNKEDISEFIIAEKLKLTVNEVRNKLYKLQTHNLVSFTRRKDQEKGWYIYYWTFKQKPTYELFYVLKKKKHDALQREIEQEGSTRFLSCKSKCQRLTFEESLENDFKCSKCGSLLKEEGKRNMSIMKKEILALEKELAKVKVQNGTYRS